MSVGGSQTPFRLSCESDGVKKSRLGFPCTPTPATVPAFGNTTRMTDHCGNSVVADKRFYETNTCGDDICSPNCNDCPGGTNLVGNTPEPPAISANTFSEIGTATIAPGAVGGKWVQAFKAGQGMFGFTYNADGTNCLTGALSNNRYRTITYDCHIRDSHITDPGGSNSTDKTGYRTVAKNAGVVTQTLTTVQSDERDLGDGLGDQITYYSSCQAGYNTEFGGTHIPFSSGGTTRLDAIDNNFQCTYPKAFPSWSETHGDDFGDLPGFLGIWNAGHIDHNSGSDPPTYSDFTGSSLPSLTDANNYSGSASGTTNEGNTEWSVSLSWTRTETEVTWDFTLTQTNFGTPVGTFHYYGTVTLSDVYTMSDVLADAVSLANEWSLTDNSKYPFRTDGHTTVAPFVCRNEVSPPVSPAGFETCDWVDPNATTYDGAIIGIPLVAGYGQPVGGNPRGVFDKDHENFFRRNCVLGPGWTQANESRGGFTPSYLPANAPKWTDDFHATTLWPCAFANADVNGVYLQKWCEIPIKRPSINFARPFGPDKFLLDETAVFYVSDFTAGVVTLKNLDFTTPGSVPFAPGDIVGSAAVGGFFAVSLVVANVVTLGALVIDLPAGWQTPSNDAHFCFGKLRFPNAPGMNFTTTTAEVGGRVAVTVVDSGGARTLTTATIQKYLSITTPENIDILDADMAVLASNIAATRLDDNNFTVPTAYATIAAAKWIVPHFLNDGSTSGQKYKFCDNRSKGDYVVRSWKIRISDSTVLATTQTDACLPSNFCGAPVATGLSPNSETDFWPFPTTINNGEVWLGQIQFWMQDPFWQPPHTPVAVADSHADFTPVTDQIVWSEDNGNCNEDSSEAGGGGTIYHLFYPMRPYVEARVSLPTNIGGESPPALASGVDLTAVADPPNQAGIGDVDGPLVDAIVLTTPIWSKYSAQKGCVDLPGRFAADYEANGTT